MRRAAPALLALFVAGCLPPTELFLYPAAAPERVTVVSQGHVFVEVTWDEVPDATGYAIYMDFTPAAGPETFVERRVELRPPASFDLPAEDGMPLEAARYLRVAAIRGNAEGPLSPVLLARGMEPRLSRQPVATFLGGEGGGCGDALVPFDYEFDGDDDLFAGCPLDAGGAGRFFLLRADETGIAVPQYFDMVGAPDSRLGAALAAMDDFRGVPAIFVGEPGTPAVRVVDPVTLTTASVLTPAGGMEADAAFGAAIAVAGDLNNDGQLDLAIGAPSATGNGCVVVMSGNAAEADRVVCNDAGVADGFGSVIAGAANVDNDSFDDLVIGAPLENGGDGAVFLVRGASQFFAGATLEMVRMPGTGAFGSALVAAGDPDGDDRDAVLAGAPSRDEDGAADTGEVVLVELDDAANAVATSMTVGFAGQQVGAGLALADFAITDAVDQVLVGSPGSGGVLLGDLHWSSEAGTFLSLDSTTWTVEGDPDYAELGTAVVSFHTNADDLPDVAVGGGDGIAVFVGAPRTGPRVTAGYPIEAEPGAQVTLQQASFTDPTPSIHTCEIDWSDGPPEVIAPCTAAMLSAHVHTLTPEAVAGTYDVRVTVRAKDGREGQSVTVLRVR